MTCSFETYFSTNRVEEHLPKIWERYLKEKETCIAISVLLLPSDLLNLLFHICMKDPVK